MAFYSMWYSALKMVIRLRISSETHEKKACTSVMIPFAVKRFILSPFALREKEVGGTPD
jgi:hypothetical protein